MLTGRKMFGTTGTTYTVVAEFETGMVGYRDLGHGKFRVRAVPEGLEVSFPADWKTPADGQGRFSTVVMGKVELTAALQLAAGILLTGNVNLDLYLTEDVTEVEPDPEPELEEAVDDNEMVGPGGTEYIVAANLANGRIGYAELGDGRFRIRIEPNAGVYFAFGSGYTQPLPDNHRYSTIVNKASLVTELKFALNTLIAASL